MKVSSNLFVRIITYYMFYIQFLFGQKTTMYNGSLLNHTFIHCGILGLFQPRLCCLNVFFWPGQVFFWRICIFSRALVNFGHIFGYLGNLGEGLDLDKPGFEALAYFALWLSVVLSSTSTLGPIAAMSNVQGCRWPSELSHSVLLCSDWFWCLFVCWFVFIFSSISVISTKSAHVRQSHYSLNLRILQ